MAEWYATEGWIYVYGIAGGLAIRAAFWLIGWNGGDGGEFPLDLDGD